MCPEHRNLTWPLMTLVLSGVLCNTSEWRVEYQEKTICAVKGSSVVIPCTFYYPNGLTVESYMWGQDKNIYNGPFIFDSTSKNTSSRFQYIGNKHHNCSLKIQQVEYNDKGKYAFRFITNTSEGKWTGAEGSELKTGDLKAVVTFPTGNRTAKEGDSVNLTCTNSCDGGDLSSAFTWFKNRQPMSEGPVLYLSNISSTHSGNYTCSLTTQDGTTSGVICIDVEYGPKNTSLSVRPSTEEDEGSNITLTCSSHANPPVENYTWFKILDDDDTEHVGNEPELHLLKTSPAHGGRYFCSALNIHGSQNSSIVTVQVKEVKADLSKRDALIIATVAALLIAATVFAVRRLCKEQTSAPETSAPETDCEEDTQNEVYLNWPVFDSSQSHEGNQCEEAKPELIYSTVQFSNNRNQNTEQQTDLAGHRDDNVDVIYSTVCRNLSYSEPL